LTSRRFPTPTRRARFIHALFKTHFQAAGFVPFTAGYAARSPWIPYGTTNFVKPSKAWLLAPPMPRYLDAAAG
jgi:hypothetical protein